MAVCVATPCTLVSGYQHFGRTYHLYLHPEREDSMFLLKCWYQFTRLCGVINQKTKICIQAAVLKPRQEKILTGWNRFSWLYIWFYILHAFQLKACIIAVASLIPETDLIADDKAVNNACVYNKASYFILKWNFSNQYKNPLSASH